MTRNEMISDVTVGDLLKIRTEYDLIVGKVECLDKTTVKVIRIDTGKPKRINYDIIVDYDFETDLIDSMKKTESAQLSVDVKRQYVENEPQIEFPVNYEIMRLWGDISFDMELSVSKGYKEYVKRFPKNVKTELNQYKDKILHAQKMHEFTPSNYRVISVLAELSNYSDNAVVPYANCMKAMINYELGNIEEAEILFYEGFDYESAFFCAYQLKKYTSCMNYAMNCFMGGCASIEIRKWLLDYARTNNRVDIASLLIKEDSSIRAQMLLFWFKDDSCMMEIPNKDALESPENDVYLFNIFKKKYSEVDSSELTAQYTPAIVPNDEVAVAKENNVVQEEEFVGKITRFEISKNFGFIDNKVFFYINQVIDEELQELLYTSATSGYQVSYTIGKNKKGDKAADKIRLIGESVIERKSGFISEFDRFEEFGRIICESKEYNFILDAVSDPYLKADILDSYNLEMIDVTFVPSKKNKKKIATDIVSAMEYDYKTIEEWIKSRVISQSEVDAWKNKKKMQRIVLLFHLFTNH